jgi:hypothetical protein
MKSKINKILIKESREKIRNQNNKKQIEKKNMTNCNLRTKLKI